MAVVECKIADTGVHLGVSYAVSLPVYYVILRVVLVPIGDAEAKVSLYFCP